TLKAPIAGTIVSVGATLGEHVETARAVFTILDATRVYIEAKVPQADVHRMGAAPSALLDGESLERPVFVGLEVDPGTRTVPILYAANNSNGRLRPGMAVTLALETSRVEETLAIPLAAVVDEDARPIAFVQLSGETFEKRELKLGIRDGDWVQVLAGLAEGDRVVTKEAFAIRLASVSSVIPAHGHAH
ncbi:MAG: efflux RND transporter periplasmic adaptor subunit, partial [Dehalococcoidia bacterium]|nr:efflux RND transporter periplasmic adaptor subunit [Dehalococcoidia bacterium]